MRARTRWEVPMDEVTTCSCCKAQRNQVGTELETSVLLLPVFPLQILHVTPSAWGAAGTCWRDSGSRLFSAWFYSLFHRREPTFGAVNDYENLLSEEIIGANRKATAVVLLCGCDMLVTVLSKHFCFSSLITPVVSCNERKPLFMVGRSYCHDA